MKQRPLGNLMSTGEMKEKSPWPRSIVDKSASPALHERKLRQSRTFLSTNFFVTCIGLHISKKKCSLPDLRCRQKTLMVARRVAVDVRGAGYPATCAINISCKSRPSSHMTVIHTPTSLQAPCSQGMENAVPRSFRSRLGTSLGLHG